MSTTGKKIIQGKKGRKKQSQSFVVNSLEVRSANNQASNISDYNEAKASATRVHSPNRTALYDIYEKIWNDPHLSGIVGKRIDTILNKEVYYKRDEKRDDRFDDLAESEMLREVMRQIMWQQMVGLSGMHFLIGKEFRFKEIPIKHIKPDLGIISLDQSGDTGFDYLDDPFIWVIGNKNSYGLFLKCAAYVLWKNGNWADWAQFIEIFGMPVRIIKYNMHDPQSKVEARKALSESGSALELLVPEGVEYEMKEGKSSNGNGELQDKFRRAINEELSVCINGNTHTTNSSDKGGFAISKTHADQQLEITKSDMVNMLNKLNSKEFRAILQSYGFPVDGGKWVFEREIDMKAVKEHMTVIIMAKRNGTPVHDDHVYEITGIPKPENYDEIKAKEEEERQALLQTALQRKEDDKPDSPGAKNMLQKLLNGFFR